jgi:hypothetical protein
MGGMALLAAPGASADPSPPPPGAGEYHCAMAFNSYSGVEGLLWGAAYGNTGRWTSYCPPSSFLPTGNWGSTAP